MLNNKYKNLHFIQNLILVNKEYYTQFYFNIMAIQKKVCKIHLKIG